MVTSSHYYNIEIVENEKYFPLNGYFHQFTSKSEKRNKPKVNVIQSTPSVEQLENFLPATEFIQSNESLFLSILGTTV
jgi:hypothetical protein